MLPPSHPSGLGPRQEAGTGWTWMSGDMWGTPHPHTFPCLLHYLTSHHHRHMAPKLPCHFSLQQMACVAWLTFCLPGSKTSTFSQHASTMVDMAGSAHAEHGIPTYQPCFAWLKSVEHFTWHDRQAAWQAGRHSQAGRQTPDRQHGGRDRAARQAFPVPLQQHDPLSPYFYSLYPVALFLS